MDVSVPAKPDVVSGVRHALESLGLPPGLRDEARLLLSELVTNSVRHAGLGPRDQIRIRAEWTGTRLRVDVWDRKEAAAGSKVTDGNRPQPGSESGWGLYLVDSLASRWSSEPGRHWFELEHEGPAGR